MSPMVLVMCLASSKAFILACRVWKLLIITMKSRNLFIVPMLKSCGNTLFSMHFQMLVRCSLAVTIMRSMLVLPMPRAG